MSSVISILIVVVLPAPFGPSSPKSSPSPTSKLTPRTASTSSDLRRIVPVVVLYVRFRSWASMTAMARKTLLRRQECPVAAAARRLDGHDVAGCELDVDLGGQRLAVQEVRAGRAVPAAVAPRRRVLP